MQRHRIFLIVLVFMVNGCGSRPNFAALEEEFVYTALSFSPVTASAAGLHNYKGANFNQMLDDISMAGFDEQRKFYRRVRGRLGELKRDGLDPQEQADFDIIQDQISLGLLELDTIQSYRHNPTIYVELIGNAIFNPWVVEYAPKPSRIQDIIARLRRVPNFVDQVKMNLESSPEIWTEVAQQENAGNIDLLRKTIAPAIPGDLRKEFGECGPAGAHGAGKPAGLFQESPGRPPRIRVEAGPRQVQPEVPLCARNRRGPGCPAG